MLSDSHGRTWSKSLETFRTSNLPFQRLSKNEKLEHSNIPVIRGSSKFLPTRIEDWFYDELLPVREVPDPKGLLKWTLSSSDASGLIIKCMDRSTRRRAAITLAEHIIKETNLFVYWMDTPSYISSVKSAYKMKYDVKEDGSEDPEALLLHNILNVWDVLFIDNPPIGDVHNWDEEIITRLIDTRMSYTSIKQYRKHIHRLPTVIVSKGGRSVLQKTYPEIDFDEFTEVEL